MQAEREAAIDAVARAEQAEQQRRQKLAEESMRILNEVMGESWKRIVAAAPSAH